MLEDFSVKDYKPPLVKRYFSHLDGLRALSVLMVLIYHLKLSFGNWFLFQGGFIGVDVFFVISGYLISLNLKNEFQETGSLKLGTFALKRAKRILPLVCIVLLVSSFVAWILLLPGELLEFSKSLLSILSFTQNLYFYFDGLGYHAQQNAPPILLHFWSLAIEEQFYIIFPILLIILFKFPHKYIFGVLLLLLIISLIISDTIANSHFYKDLNFYFTFSRMWEFLVGALLALFSSKKQQKIDFSIFGDIGIVLIITSGIVFDHDTNHPGLNTLLPVIGSALTIVFGDRCNLRYLLVNGFSQYLGKISYGIYLWHFIFISFAIYGGEELNSLSKTLLVFAVLLISVVSFHLVENQFRQKFSTTSFFLLVLSSYIILISFSLISIKNNGFPNRFPEIFSAGFSSFTPYLAEQNGRRCFGRQGSFCNYSAESEASVYVIGDSHAASIAYAVAKDFEGKVNIKIMAEGGCYFLPNTYLKYQGTKTSCDEKFQQIRLAEVIPKNSIIIIAGNLGQYLSGKTINGVDGPKVVSANTKSIEENFRLTIDKLTSSGSKIILVYPMPEMKFDTAQYLLKWFKFQTDKNDFPIINQKIEDYFERQAKSFELLDSIDNPGVYRFYPHKFLCNNEVCAANSQTEIFFTDKTHLSENGLKLIYLNLKETLNSTIREVNFKY